MRGIFDKDEDDAGDYLEYYDEYDCDPIACPCGRDSCAEACEQCGTPLCAMCFETGAGFCANHPDEEFRGDELRRAGVL